MKTPIKGIDFPGITIVMICHDGQGNILLNKRSQNCRDEIGNWDPGGGGVDFGEGLEETLRKELMEEYCVESLEHEFIGYGDLHRELEGRPTHWLAMYFLVKVDRDQVKIGEPHKHEEIGWFKLDDLPTPLHSQFPLLLKKYGQKIKELL